jgi:hypothetical protein
VVTDEHTVLYPLIPPGTFPLFWVLGEWLGGWAWLGLVLFCIWALGREAKVRFDLMSRVIFAFAMSEVRDGWSCFGTGWT